MEKLQRIAAPAGEKLRQIQKMVHDIKKNEGGFMSKIKKITNKAPPSVPHRDYIEDEDDEDHWSDDFDSDYENPDEQHSDSEQYVVPGEEDNYEPPPMETEKKKIAPGFAFPKGDYADNRTNRQPPFSKPLPSVPSQPPSKPNPASSQPQSAVKKPHVSPRLPKCNNDEADYVVPVDDDKEEDNNYIEPTQENLPQLKKFPPPTRSTRPTPPAKSPAAPVATSTPAVYEILEKEEKPSPPLPNRTTKPLPPKPSLGMNLPSLPNRSAVKDSSVVDPPRNALPIPRNHSQPKLNLFQELPQDDDYEVCDDNHNDIRMTESKFSSTSIPAPLPRTGKKMPTPPKPKPNVPSRENLNISEVKPTAPERLERRRGSSVGSELPPVPALKPVFQKPAVLTKSPDVTSRNTGTLPRNTPSCSTAEQEAGVYSKVWYASSCDRKAAEEALHKSNKDGSFLVRKSSGQDLKQPYTLVVFYNRRVFNIPVRYIESTKQYAMGREKSGEEHFDSVADMIQNHQRNSLVLIDSQNNTKDSTKLKYPVRVS